MASCFPELLSWGKAGWTPNPGSLGASIAVTCRDSWRWRSRRGRGYTSCATKGCADRPPGLAQHPVSTASACCNRARPASSTYWPVTASGPRSGCPGAEPTWPALPLASRRLKSVPRATVPPSEAAADPGPPQGPDAALADQRTLLFHAGNTLVKPQHPEALQTLPASASIEVQPP